MIKNQIQKMREEKGGFTLMELLIVVAIIAVLVAIMIPTVSSSLTKAKESADVANIRSAVATAQANVLTESTADVTAASAWTAAYDAIGDNTLNYCGEGQKLTVVTSDDNGLVTITYSPDKINDKEDYVWTVESPDYTSDEV